MNKIVIYPGRFQPMLSHHAEVFKQLQSQFPDAEVYIGTSDKVELPKSPFNFKEKQMIAAAHGVPEDRVLAVTRPYHQEDYAKYFNPADTIIIFAVGEKDLDRFPFSNMDPSTGLDMTVRGETKPKYYQKINTLKAEPKPMSERGYITLAPTIKIGDEVASASAFRDALKSAPDVESAKQIYTKQFGTYNDKVFNLIYNKIARADMSEQINILRKLAGLPVSEAAPVDFSGADPKLAKFLPPNASSAKMSIANRFPKGADVNDLETKKEQFIQALLRSPEALISEFSERLDPKDDNSLAVGQKLSDIVQFMNQKDVDMRGVPNDMKKFVLDLTVNAVKNMELKAGDDSPAYDDMEGEDEFEKESVDLSSIRNDYGIQEGDGTEGQCPECDGSGCDHCDDTGWDPAFGNDDAPSQEEIDADAHSKEESFDPSKEPSREQVAYDEAMDILAKEGEEGLAKHLGMSEQELDQEINQWCAEHGKHADDDREEAIDGVLDDVISNADWDSHYEAKNPNEAVEETASNALEAAMVELRKLAGLR